MKKADRFREQFVAAGHYYEESKYWLNQLSGELEKASFPCDENKGYPAEYTLKQVNAVFPEDVCAMIIKLSSGSDARVYMILAAALVVLVNKYTAIEDVIIGSPVQKQEARGELINSLLALRTRVTGEMTFKQLLLQVREVIIEANENQNYPIETLAYQLNKTSTTGFPLFDIAIVYQNLYDRSYIDHVDLNMIYSFHKTVETIRCNLEYNSSIYKEASVQRILKRFFILLRRALTNVDITLANLDILSNQERKQLLYQFNRTASAFPANETIHQQVEKHAAEAGDNTAVVFEDKQITYTEINKKANTLARVLKEKAVKPGTIVAVMVDRSMEMLVGILAILKAGSAYLPIDPGYPEERIKHLLADCSARVAVTTEDLADKVKTVNCLWLMVNCRQKEPILNLPAGHRSPPAARGPHRQLAYVIYTSGSTGKPKGIPVSHRNVNNYAAWFKKEFVITAADKFAFTGSFCFDMAVTSLIVPLICGAVVNTVKDKIEWDPWLYARYLAVHKISVIKLTPSQFKLLWDFIAAEDLKGLRYIILGGEAVEANHVTQYLRTYNRQKIVNEYGPTEATVGTVFYVVTADHFTPGKTRDQAAPTTLPIGKPILNTQVYILDKYANIVPIGVPGELSIGGVPVAAGYLNNPELTAEKFLSVSYRSNKSYRTYSSSKIYKTGDLARWLLDGNIEFLGRIDLQVKIKGFRIEPAEIAHRLAKYKTIKEAVVVTREDQRGDPYLCAYIVPLSPSSTNPQQSNDSPDPALINDSELKDYLSTYLPDHMIPSFFVPMDTIPLTPNGKIDKKALPEPMMNRPGEKYTPPRDQTEEKLVHIWSEVLGIGQSHPPLGIHDHFFRLGGHSLNAILLTARIHKAFHVKVPLLELFKAPRIRQLAAYIKNAQKNKYAPIHVVEKKEYYPLSSAQKRLYILQQMETGHSGYNMPEAVVLEGELQEEKLEQVFANLLKRHENLRTSFELIGNEPVQKISQDVEFGIKYFETNEEDAKDIIADFKQPFDLAKPPLMRVERVKIAKKKYILMIDMHHIIMDGASLEILIKELKTLYSGQALPSLRIQYKDYSEWKYSEEQTTAVKSQEEYWLQCFNREIPLVNMPTDYPRPPVLSFQGDNISVEIDTSLATGIKQAVLETGTTLFIFLLAVFNILLAKYTSQEDIVVGSPVAGRNHDDLKNIIGMFVNMVVLRNQPHRNKTFNRFLTEVKENSLQAFENQDYQFEELVLKLGLQGHSNRNPMFDFVFQTQKIQNTGSEYQRFEQKARLNIKAFNYHFKQSRFDLLFSASEKKEKIILDLIYSTALFKASTARKILDHYIEILEQVIKDRDVQLNDIKMAYHLLPLQSKSFLEGQGEFQF